MSAEHIDYDKLGKAVADNLRGHCSLGLSPEDGETLRDFARSWRSAKATALATVVGVLATGTIAMFGKGMWAWVKGP